MAQTAGLFEETAVRRSRKTREAHEGHLGLQEEPEAGQALQGLGGEQRGRRTRSGMLDRMAERNAGWSGITAGAKCQLERNAG